MTVAADPAAAHVLQFCRGVADDIPLAIHYRPLPDEPLNECFAVVKQQVAAHGGAQVVGWAIWEWPGVMIEAEFHCVWLAPDGLLVDVTPKPKHLAAITFLPDRKRQYRCRQVDNIRKPLVQSLTLRKFIAAHEQLFRLLNEGDLAHYHGPVELSPAGIKLYDRVVDLEHKLISKFGPRP